MTRSTNIDSLDDLDSSVWTRDPLEASFAGSDPTQRPSILFVDDEPKILDAFRRMLHPFATNWETYFISDSRTVLQTVLNHRVDVVVTDLSMPFVSGIELVQQLKQNPETKYIPVIVVTGQNDRGLKRQALDSGAADLLNKPILLEELLARIRNSLHLKACYDELHSKNAELEFRVHQRTLELQQSRLEIIARLSKAAEYRDSDTGHHVIRVAHYSRLIAQELKLPPNEVEAIFAAAPLHDVGKIAIPDSILLKAGHLTEEERHLMQTHCKVGANILGGTAEMPLDTEVGGIEGHNLLATAVSDPVLNAAREIAATHHEHWDGRGYPEGLEGEQIPLAGRIVALADVFDALTSARSYKPSYSMDESLRIISEKVGKQFDPRVHSAFLAAIPKIDALCARLRDDAPNAVPKIPVDPTHNDGIQENDVSNTPSKSQAFDYRTPDAKDSKMSLSSTITLIEEKLPLGEDNFDEFSERQSVRRGMVAAFSLAIAIAGLAVMVGYAQSPGPRDKTPAHWPQSTEIHPEFSRPTLVVFLHPHCPCSRATLSELETLLSDGISVRTVIVFLRPSQTQENWEQGEMWDRANSIRGVEVLVDRDGIESQRFGAATSGHVCLYRVDGRLQFSGGITLARGHVGENQGRESINTFLALGHSMITTTPVYGCPLFSDCETKTPE